MSETLIAGQQETTEPNGAQAVDEGAPAETADTGGGEGAPDTADDKSDASGTRESRDGDDKATGDDKPKDGDDKGDKGKKDDVPETYDLKVPEGSRLDDAAIERVSETAKELGLTNEQAQKLVDMQDQSVTGFTQHAQEQFDQQITQWEQDVKADKEIGGEHWEGNLKNIHAVMEKYATPEFKAALNESGYGSHPELVRFMARIGKAMAEDTPVGGEEARGGKRSRAEILYGPTKE